jgi:hypothetical protein
VESYGSPPVIVYAPENPIAEGMSRGTSADNVRHGNFFDASYAAVAARADWMRRFDKIHAQGRALPKAERRWRELDSSMSSDALLMNVFCAPGVADSTVVRSALGVDGDVAPIFGWKARVPLAPGPHGRARFDRTEVDMRWDGLLVEAKLTESDFQTRAARIVEAYRDFDAVFERDLLPRVELRPARRRTAVEFAEEYTQEWEGEAAEDSVPSEAEAHSSEDESKYGLKPVPFASEARLREEAARAFQQGIVARAREAEPAEPAYAGYQLIRNVLAAYAEGCSFCVVHDERRPDLREAWFEVMAAVKTAQMRVRCKVMTWQELAGTVPDDLQEFLELKYGIVCGGGGWVASLGEGIG